jgi:hypothetical protein
MGFKLAMPQFSVSKSESSALAQTHARLKAWWNGEEAPTLSVVETNSTSLNDDTKAEIDWDVIHPAARAALWGTGRSYPSTAELEGQLILEAGGAKASRIALFGSGTGAMARVISEKTAAKLEIFENEPTARAITEKVLKATKQAKRFGFHGFDWQPGTLPKSKADAAVFMFQGGQEGRIEAGAFCAERILRAGASAVWLDFFARKDDEALDACRGHEARQFGTEEEATIAFSASGLTVSADDDYGAQFLDALDVSWRDLAINLGLRQAALIKEGGIHASTSALQNLICWKARSEAIRSGKLMVRRYILTSI